jgi:HlyD family secretion protein
MSTDNLPVASPSGWPEVPPTPSHRCRGVIRAGYISIGIFIVGTTLWSVFAPLESAAIAPGFVEVESRRKVVQHLEGGIVGAILVKDGQRVSVGDVVLRLDDTKARTSLSVLQSRLWDALAAEARLTAERAGASQVSYPEELLAMNDDPVVGRIVAGQNKIFETRRALQASKVRLVQQRIAKSKEEIIGLGGQQSATERRIGFVRRELASVKDLFSKGYERQPRMLALEGDQAELEGQRARLASDAARAQQTIAESELTIVSLNNQLQQEISGDLQDTRQTILQTRQHIQQWRDVLKRTEVRAPVSGVVTELKVYATGAVVGPGEPLMEIVPQSEKLVVTAQLRPEDIDSVHPGLPAQVHLTPYKQRHVPPVEGKVFYVSPDALTQKQSGLTYYEAKIELDPASAKSIDVLPGMPAQAMIRTGKRTVALYALSPIMDSFDRAFRDK